MFTRGLPVHFPSRTGMRSSLCRGVGLREGINFISHSLGRGDHKDKHDGGYS